MTSLRQRPRVRQTETVEAKTQPLAEGRPTALRPGLPRIAVGQGLGRVGSRAWGRYAPGMAIVLTLGLLARLPGLAAAPLDAPGPQQAALAAFVHQIGRAEGQARLVLPWTGPVPLDLTGGLPLYAWLTTLLTTFGPGETWPGRALSLGAGLVATLFLFGVMRRLAGGRAAVYAALFLAVSPLALYYGRAYLPDALNWALSLAAIGAALRWRDSGIAGRPRQSLWLALAALLGGLAVAAAPGNPLLLAPLLYIAWPRLIYQPDYEQRLLLDPHHADFVAQAGRRQLVVYGLVALLPLLLWQVGVRVGNMVTPLDANLGGGPGAALRLLTSGSFYGLLLGLVVNNLLTVIGVLLVLAGLGRRVRLPWPWLLHVWLGGAVVGLLVQAPRLTGDESALTPLLPALAGLAGLGAAWLATLPAQIAAVWRGGAAQELGDGEMESAEFTAAHTADLTARPAHGAVRRQGWEAADPLGAQQARRLAWQRVLGRLVLVGHTVVVLSFAGMVWLALPRLLAHYQPDPAGLTYAEAGQRVAAAGESDRRLVVAGPGAAEIFYASGLTGWTLPAEDFSRERVDKLHAAGAQLLASADQAWLGRLPEYAGLLASFRVAILDKRFIVFDLNTPPESTDRLYFWESGHTLRGGFRDFWEKNGGLAQFGFPLTEELQLADPDDGTVRTTQVFQRAVFEVHDDVHQVFLAPLGRWLTKTKDPNGPGWKPVAALPNTPDRHFFPETGHTVRGGFWQTWQARGGLAVFGFPISQEVHEINPADGKDHVVQYFERARFELHPEAVGTPNYIQLGLVGEEWWDARQQAEGKP